MAIEELVSLVKRHKFTTIALSTIAAVSLYLQVDCMNHESDVFNEHPVVESVGFLHKDSGYDLDHDGKIDMVERYQINDYGRGVGYILLKGNPVVDQMQKKFSSRYSR
jgi:hypothetical protein